MVLCACAVVGEVAFQLTFDIPTFDITWVGPGSRRLTLHGWGLVPDI